MATIGVLILLLAIVAFMFYMMTKKGAGCCGAGSDPGVGGGSCCTKDGDQGTSQEHANHSHTDPVCGMSVDPGSDLTAAYKGKSYHFCSDNCRRSFAAEPIKYVGQ